MTEDSTTRCGGSDDATGQSASTVFDLLASERRRYLLVALMEHGPTIALPDLADEVATREYAVPFSEIPEEDVLDIYSLLYHKHVPKLVDAGVVAYDQEHDLVRLTNVDESLERFLRETPEGSEYLD